MRSFAYRKNLESVNRLAGEILERGRAISPSLELPRRVVHGDLKATNLLLVQGDRDASAIIDLDTLGVGDLATEMGDAVRSWCNPVDEADRATYFDGARFVAAMEGYGAITSGWIQAEEVRAIPESVVRIAVELASRFCLDAYEDRYFGWDPSRFGSRREHNLARAEAQLALASSARTQLDAMHASLADIFSLGETPT